MIPSCTYTIIITVILLISSTSSVRQHLYYNLLSPIEKSPSFLSASRKDNLREILNYIRNSTEFFPLTFSIIFPKYHSSVVDFLSKYVAENSINAYAIKASELSRELSWHDRGDVTWILFAEDPSSLNALVRWKRKLWKSRNRYLIFYTNESAAIPWRKIFEDLWRRHNVYRAIITSIQDNFRCFVKYLPFDHIHDKFGSVHRSCLKEEVSRVIKQNYSSFDQTDRNTKAYDVDRISFFAHDEEFFESFRDLKNYTMHVVVFASLMMNISYGTNNRVKLTNLDARIINLLKETMRMKLRAKVLTGLSKEEDPFDRALTFIENGTAEMIITGYFMKKYSGYREYEFTAAVYEDELCLIAPAAGLVSKSYMPFLPFKKDLWTLLIIYNIVISVLWMLLKYVSKSFRSTNIPTLMSDSFSSENTYREINISPCFISREQSLLHGNNRGFLQEEFSTRSFNGSQLRVRKFDYVKATTVRTRTDSVLFENPPEVHPYLMTCFELIETLCYPLQGASTASQRAFLFGTLFFGLIVTGLYQSFLVSSLSKPFHYPELKTLEDVLASNLTIITKYSNLKRTFDDETTIGRRLTRKIEVTNTSKPTYDLVACTKQVIALGRRSSVKLENLSHYYDHEGNDLLHIVEECPLSFMVSYVLRSHSPYRERVNMVLLRIREAGLIDLWYQNMIYPYEVESRTRNAARSERRIKLTLEHYSLTFLLLFVGLLGCTLVFVGEMYVAKRLTCQIIRRKI